MLRINKFTCENLGNGCVTDERNPLFAFSVQSDKNGAEIVKATLSCNGWREDVTSKQTGVRYSGGKLKPFTSYSATLEVEDNFGEKASSSVLFETGLMNEKWQAEWITDGEYTFNEKRTSPVPMTFKKEFSLKGKVKSAKIYSTAMGIYELKLNGEKVGKDYFAPGFTSYKNQLQYETYDITEAVKENNEIKAVVSGGWAVGAFVFTRVNKYAADRQALLAQIRIVYEDGSVEIIGTDESWLVTMSSPLRFAEFYDGEVYDATACEENWIKAKKETLRVSPQIIAEYGSPVREHEVFKPVSVTKAKSGELIYDFAQNFAGVVRFKVKGKSGQKITIRHAEILTPDGELNTAFLRTAKCSIVYTCKDGEQSYCPSMTYMGFRYAGVTGVDEKDIEIEAVALYSDLEKRGEFSCSDERINKLQSNIVWSGKSNFVDIPTDCPQRDERMGWTGDIAVFSPTACFNFDIARFLNKWLKDLRSEQTRGGGIPNTVPVHGYGFPATMPKKAIAFWGDACIFVPWALYNAYGDSEILKIMYPTMKKYIKACKFWAGLFSFGKNRYIWSDIPAMQFGDWVAPDVPQMSQWQARSKWTATAALSYSSGLVADAAKLLGFDDDEKYYRELSKKTADAYVSVFTDGNGKLKEEFQTGYVLPLQFKIFDKEDEKKAVENLVKLIEKNEYRIGTGFPGTPYILFALADNGRADVAYKMLLNTKCPSWLYEVQAGATTVWERWDGLNEDGVCPISNDGTDNMISFNHYAFGAVGDFLYRRVAGIEPVEGGYKKFKIAPLVGGGLTSANASVNTPYGTASVSWKKDSDNFTIEVSVPVGTNCELVMPSGEVKILQSGKYTFAE